jgi:hypothetical protein
MFLKIGAPRLDNRAGSRSVNDSVRVKQDVDTDLVNDLIVTSAASDNLRPLDGFGLGNDFS